MQKKNTPSIIMVDNLTHFYGEFKAVDQVSLTVESGEIFGFLGPNGAGKTTTIRTILDFIRPSSGAVRVFGQDVRGQGVEIRKQIGYLPSELTLWENWTGVQYIRWLEGVRRQTILPEAQRLAEALDFDLKRSLKGMSTGMKRKMGLIAAMAHRPELLILDEPTNGLDPLMQKVFHELMLAVKAEGRTVFLSSHLLHEVEQICDRVAIIRQGRVEAVETVADLMRVKFRHLALVIDATPGGTLSPNGFSAISGVSDVAIKGDTITMRVTGDADMDAVIKQAAHYTIRDIRINQPSLEEIFLGFYGTQEEV